MTRILQIGFGKGAKAPRPAAAGVSGLGESPRESGARCRHVGRGQRPNTPKTKSGKECRMSQPLPWDEAWLSNPTQGRAGGEGRGAAPAPAGLPGWTPCPGLSRGAEKASSGASGGPITSNIVSAKLAIGFLPKMLLCRPEEKESAFTQRGEGSRASFRDSPGLPGSSPAGALA